MGRKYIACTRRLKSWVQRAKSIACMQGLQSLAQRASWWNFSRSVATNALSGLATLLFGHFPDQYLELIAMCIGRAEAENVRVAESVERVRLALEVFRKYWGILDYA
jgi:hypothetical protein